MPQDIKASPEPFKPQTLEGTVLETLTKADQHEAVRLAFDYRGDVTMTFKDFGPVIGYIYNYDPTHDLIQAFVVEGKDSVPRNFRMSSLQKLEFSGEDKAFGKSWDAWMQKSAKQRQAEAAAEAERARALGNL